MHKIKLVRRIISGVTACVLALCLAVPFSNVFADAAASDPDLSQQSIRLYPDENNTDKTVSLKGLMPENAKAEAVDVTDDYSNGRSQKVSDINDRVLAAYDITIMNGRKEYQPGSSNPIFVEIKDPAITDKGSVELWHVKDNGDREQIKNFVVSSGRISFYATGFSVYEIVTDGNSVSAGWLKVTSIADLESYNTNGFYISSSATDNNKYHFVSNTVISNVGGTSTRTGIIKTKGAYTVVNGTDFEDCGAVKDENKAVPYYFEELSVSADGKSATCYIYCLDTDGVTKKYVYNNDNNSLGFGEKTQFLVSCNNNGTFTIKNNTYKLYWNEQGGPTWGSDGKRQSFACYNSPTNLYFYTYIPFEDDAFGLDGKTFGLMNYEGGAVGNALMANETKTFEKLTQLVSRDKDNASDKRMLYVSQNSDITEWTFNTAGKNDYKISTVVNGTVKYLKSDGTSLSLVNDSDDATAFKYRPNGSSDGSFKLGAGDKYISFDQTNGFTMSDNGSAICFVKKTKLSDSDSITYTANRISVSDGEQACDGKEVIVYTRIWDDIDKKYNFYAIDHDGSLMPCYASGDKLMWLDDATNSLMWKLTVYKDNNGDETGYYELQNTYSGKFIAPQLTGGQVLSNKKIGIQLPGRKYERSSEGTYSYGEYYSSIVAWDKRYYDYAALKGSADHNAKEGSISSAVYAQADSFYFAILESADPNENQSSLHEVETVDNYKYGINMRLIDFVSKNSKSEITVDYFDNIPNGQKKGLLSTNLNEETGHPSVVSNGKDFGAAFDKAVPVNHLFVTSVHESSGYFEYDSCQNFATVKGGKDSNGNYDGSETKYERTYKDENNVTQTMTVNNFTVFKELGTAEGDGRRTLKHGQFFPYNYIRPGVYSQKNPENLYSSSADLNDATKGLLSDDDPRKYEKLHVVTGDVDYYLGMEMDAKFVQTPSGLDTWGHDVIFEFTGDDDFWLYVDKELIIDLGGTHSAQAGKVNFRTGEVTYDDSGCTGGVKNTSLRELFIEHYIERGDSQETAEEKAAAIFVKKNVKVTKADGTTENKECYVFKDYSEHEMKIYYMERGAGASNLHMKFNLSSVTPGNVLFAKQLSSHEGHESDLDDMDYNLVQYPFQIMYKYTEEDKAWQYLDNSNSDQPSVSYQNSTQTVKFEPSYTPPNYPSERDPYKNVFFLIPNKNIEISFPDNAMYYKIVECAVNTDNYDQVSVNGNAVTGIEISGNIKDLYSEAAKVSEQPTITFDNRVSEGNIRTLNITKKLYDENGKGADNELYYQNSDPEKADRIDRTRFDIRLYLSNGTSDELKLADLCRYYVLDPSGHLCMWDADNQVFISTTTLASDVTTLSDADKAKITFHSSRYGAISNIPAGYTVRVPGLPAGTKFMVEERDYEIPTGYDLIDFDCKKGSNGTTTYLVDKTYKYDGQTYNIAETDKLYNSVGTIRAGYDAEMMLNNRRGYGLEAEKKWSDQDFTSSHDPIYTAVYINNTLVSGSVRQITSDNPSVKYFFERLEENKKISDYVIREVVLTDPVVDSSGAVTSSSITPLAENQTVDVSVTDNNGNKSTQTYTAKYTAGAEKKTAEALEDVNIRKDLISNIRKGGITIDLYKWNTSTENDVALEGGTFVLTCDGDEAGTFVSDETGSVTVLYDFQTNKQYTLTETIAPVGYTGLLEPISFTITENNGKYSISTWSNHNDDDDDIVNTDGKFWAEYKNDPGYGIAAKIDVYNRPYTLRAVKVNKKTNAPLNDVVFSLHRTITLYGEKMKDFNPLLGYSALKSGDGVDDGIIPKIDNTLEPDTYYLTEKQVPDDFDKLDSDVVFTVSKLGVVSLESESDNVSLEVNTSNNEYVLTVANKPKSATAELTIFKTVSGSLGDRSKQFTFTLTVDDAGENDEYEWSKNGTEQTDALVSGGTFTLSHGESVTITLPTNVNITLSESNENYTTTYKLGDADAVENAAYEFELEDDSALKVTNTLNGIVPTGIRVGKTFTLALISVLIASWFMLGYIKNRKQEQN